MATSATMNGNEETMSKIAILTDSSCDIPQELAEKYGIDIMGFHILLDDVDYVERESCTNIEFYDKMRAAKGIPSTAAITPIQFCEQYCKYVDEGYTDVIHVPINKSGSSTYNNAVMAQGMLREERPEHHLKIHLIDPHTYSMVFGWYLCEMARKLRNGAEIPMVIHEFEDKMNRMEIILGPYSLKQMKKSGRISAAAAVMGELMGIRPIITLIDGKTKVEGKVRGDDKVVPAMIELCKKRAGDVEDFDYMIGHTNIPQAAELEKACRKPLAKTRLSPLRWAASFLPTPAPIPWRWCMWATQETKNTPSPSRKCSTAPPKREPSLASPVGRGAEQSEAERAFCCIPIIFML